MVTRQQLLSAGYSPAAVRGRLRRGTLGLGRPAQADQRLGQCAAEVSLADDVMEGEIVQYFASFVDLTRHKDAEAHSKMLIDELNHRVKNTLATVQSIVWQALRTAPAPGASPDRLRYAFASCQQINDSWFVAHRAAAVEPDHAHVLEQERDAAGAPGNGVYHGCARLGL